MKCGFSELDITPCLGSIIPGAFGARYSNEILDALFVRAFVAKTETKTVALAVIDACGLYLDLTEAVKARASEMTGIAKEDILVMGTHTHGGGPTLNWGEEIVVDEEYLDFVTKKASDAIFLANKKAEESELYIGKKELTDISFIRVYKMKDGGLKTNPQPIERDMIDEPITTIDPEVMVLSVKQNDEFVGAIVNFANHPATVSTTQITGDYISILSKEMKKIYGADFVTLFVNGACGNINHINPFDDETRAKDRYRTVGRKLAEKAAEVISESKIMDDNNLSSIDGNVTLKFRKPSAERVAEAVKCFENLGDELILSKPGNPNYWDTFFAIQTFSVIADKRTQRDAYLQILKIGSCYIFGTPAQIFVEFGKKMKAACDGYCFVSAFSNDYLGYVPTPDAMVEGVYEATLATTSCLEPAAGDKLADKMIELYGKIASAN